MKNLWRGLFVAAGVLIVWGGSQHPDGTTMAQMLADPTWRPTHMLMLVGFVALTVALATWIRMAPPPMRRLMMLIVAAAALQTFEMFLHTIADVDAENARVGGSTPVLTAHLQMSLFVYPIFAVAMIAFIVRMTQARLIGSKWIAWLGVLGVAAHGLSSPLVLGLRIPQAVILFPMLILLAVWLVLAGIWPAPRTAGAPAGV